jgi:Fe2+ transport system protein FeoA
MADLGITIGSTATVVGRSRTAVIVATRGGRLAIGLSLAAGVIVETGTQEGAG